MRRAPGNRRSFFWRPSSSSRCRTATSVIHGVAAQRAMTDNAPMQRDSAFGSMAFGSTAFGSMAPPRVASLFAVGALVVALTSAASCDGPNEFTPQPPDAGIDDAAITVLDIGTPCSYDFNNPSAVSPSNQCKNNLTCMIFTRDALVNPGFDLPGWEDQFTTYAETEDIGYCTLKGTYANPPACPAGTSLKLVWSDTAICVRDCSTASECGRADYTCDARFLDVGPTCVRKCSLDVPDCIRSGIIEAPPQSGQLVPVLDFDDMQGASTCNVSTGQCEFVQTHGSAGPGEPCITSADCAAGSGACIQALALDALLIDTDINLDGPGFCASPCTPVDPNVADPTSNCTVGYVCQAAGNLNINFNLIGGPFVVSQQTGAVDARGGFCFHQCVEGVEAACAPFPGTQCGSLDETAVSDNWNGITQCMPDSIRN